MSASAVVDSAPMRGSEGLGYGTQISVDGGYAAARKLADPGAARELLSGILRLVEPPASHLGPGEVVVVEAGADGLSAGVISGETVAVLHTFPVMGAVTLHLFSGHDLSLSGAIKLFLSTYEIGRFQSAVRSFGRYLPRNPEQLAHAINGERAYARLRLSPPAVVTP